MLIVAFILLGSIYLPTVAQAWEVDGSSVCTAQGFQRDPLIAADGEGGAYIAWFDYYRYALEGGQVVYVHRVDQSGETYAGWPVDGLIVSPPPVSGNTFLTDLSIDSEGGALLGFYASLDRGAYVQRVLGSGVVASGWPDTGLVVANDPGVQADVRVASDGEGGAYATWTDRGPAGRSAIQRIEADGTVAPSWPAGGMPLEPQQFFAQLIRLVSVEDGAIAVWLSRSFITGAIHIKGQRYTSAGLHAPDWPDTGVLLTVAPGKPLPNDLVTDSDGGVYSVFDDERPVLGSGDRRGIYVQRLLGNGTVPLSWPADGVLLAFAAGVRQVPQACVDGSGGLIVAWEDYRSGPSKIYAMRVLANGTLAPEWPANGVLLSSNPGYHLRPKICEDGFGGAFVTWYTDGATGWVQHIDGNGVATGGFPPNGLRISNSFSQYATDITAMPGGAIVAWEDSRNYDVTFTDIYAQKVVADGLVGITATLVSSEATPEQVRISWLVQGSGALEIERRTGSSDWATLATITPDGTGRVDHVDPGVTPGERYAYRLRRGGEVSPESWVEVPLAYRFALAGAVPNPTRSGAATVAFQLDRAGSVELEAFDLAGRSVHRYAGRHEPGAHRLRVESALAPGLYWLRLTQGTRHATARMVVIQ